MARKPDHLVIVSQNAALYWQAGPACARIKRDGISAAMNSVTLRARLEPVLRRLFHLYWLFARGMTLGVRAVVVDRDDRVFLVKHSYVAGWHLPGGGVETGETFLDALRRELVEEGRIELVGEPVLHGMFFNGHVSRRDHVAVYIVRQFRQDRLPEPNREIIACGFFETAALPTGTTEGTRRRIGEVLDGRARIATWR
jgi:ADP-ribose pyrophosphatase YjhB (NUDIX family)